MNIGSWNSDSINQLLSSGSKGSSNSMSSIYNNLSELGSIKSGSYAKLAKKYYANESNSTNKKKANSVTKKDTDSTTALSKELTQIDDASKKLVDASAKLYKDTTLFKSDNADKLTSAVTNYVDSYNKAMKEASASEVDGVASAAASMALQMSLGWPCDPIPGGYNQPCISRVSTIVSMSFVFSQMALSGQKSVLPFHEVVDIMDTMGREMPTKYKCTSCGGTCEAPTAKKCKEEFSKWHGGKDNVSL